MKMSFYIKILLFLGLSSLWFQAYFLSQKNGKKTDDPLLVVVLMVKNEAAVMEKTLQPFVDAGLDSFMIFDTGSTDDTVGVTKRFFAKHNIANAVIKQEPFVDFSTSRNRAIELTEHAFPNACFMFMIDAEWYMHNVQGLVQFCAEHKDDDGKAYCVRGVAEKGNLYFWRLIRCRSGVKFVGVVHEDLNDGHEMVPAECFFEYAPSNDGIEKTKKRNLLDVELLLKAYGKDPSNPRTAYYLGQTYGNFDDFENARMWYERRVAMSGDQEERFNACYRLGIFYAILGDWENALKSYLKAFSMRSSRAEPLVRIAQHYCVDGDAPLCFLFAQYAAELPFPDKDVAVHDVDLYNVERYDLLGWAAYTTGKYKIGKWAIEQALKAKPTSEQLQKNLVFFTELLEKAH